MLYLPHIYFIIFKMKISDKKIQRFDEWFFTLIQIKIKVNQGVKVQI